MFIVPFPSIFFICLLFGDFKADCHISFCMCWNYTQPVLAMALTYCLMEILTKRKIYFLRQINHYQMSVSTHRAPCLWSAVITSKVHLSSVCKPRQFSQQALAKEPRHSLLFFISYLHTQLCHSSPSATLHLREYQIKSICRFKYLRCCLLLNSPHGFQMLIFYEDQDSILSASTILSLESIK